MKALLMTCVAHRPRHPFSKRLGSAVLLLSFLAACGSKVAAEIKAPELSHELNRLATPLAAPPFSLLDMDGETHTLADYRGKVIMLNFWATWCPPCRREIPSMESIYQDLKDEAFIVLAINEFETPDHVFAYTGQLDVFPNFPILFDRDSRISQLYGVKGLPMTFLLDKQGMIVYRAIGGRDFDHPQVREIVRGLITSAD